MKDKLELVSLCFKKYKTLLLKRGMNTKKVCCIFKSYVYNALKYKKLYIKLYLQFLLDKVLL